MTHAPDGRGTVDGSRAAPASRDSTPKLRVRSRFLLCSGLSCLDRPLAKSRRATHERPRRLGLARGGAYWSDRHGETAIRTASESQVGESGHLAHARRFKLVGRVCASSFASGRSGETVPSPTFFKWNSIAPAAPSSRAVSRTFWASCVSKRGLPIPRVAR